MIADTKKVQTMINVLADQMTIIRSAVATMVAVKTAYITINPDPTGTPLQGNVAAVNTALTALKSETDKALWTTLIKAKVPSHTNNAIQF